ncbi:MAG: AhpC/TSA family [Pseudomonadota bacterium]|jgi:peroxiredoxin
MFAGRDLALALGLAACHATAPLAVGDVAPDFSLLDVNPASASYGEALGPSSFEGRVVLWYFGHANCGYCAAQFGVLDQIADDLAATGVDLPILGVNAAGLEDSNDAFTAGRVLPWLQDVATTDAWGAWGAEWRDAVVLDAQLRVVDKRNLTSFDLTDDGHQAAYTEALITLAAAGAAPAE